MRVITCAAVLLIPVFGSPLAAQQSRTERAPTWVVGARPEVSIGEADGPDEYLFKSIVSARFLPDQRVVVADGGYFEVRIYGRNGVHQTTFGRSGRGPREFSHLMGMWLTPQSKIAIWDAGTRRITVLDSQGRFENTHAVRAPFASGLEIFFGSFLNGDIVLGALSFGEQARESGLIPDRVTLGRFGLNGEYQGTLGELSGMRRYRNTPVAFSALPFAVLDRDSIFASDGYNGEVLVRDGRGRSVRALPIPAVPRVAADAVWSTLEAHLRASNKTIFLSYLDRGTVPKDDRFPQVSGLLTDDSNNVWVKAFDPFRDSIWMKDNALRAAPGGEWRVISPAGELIAVVRMPNGVRPLEIKGNRLLGVSFDLFGVQRIVVHTIQR